MPLETNVGTNSYSYNMKDEMTTLKEVEGIRNNLKNANFNAINALHITVFYCN